jgi:hypothetical protein
MYSIAAGVMLLLSNSSQDTVLPAILLVLLLHALNGQHNLLSILVPLYACTRTGQRAHNKVLAASACNK